MIFLKKQTKGFTLIELLVVIAIIGIISSVILASLNNGKAKARDSERKQDMIQVRTALNMYFNDKGSYPSTNGTWYGMSIMGGSRTTSGANAYIPGLVPTYIPILPADPSGNTSWWYGFLYRSDITNYKFLVWGTPESYPGLGQPFYDPKRPNLAWMICSGEPACSTW